MENLSYFILYEYAKAKYSLVATGNRIAKFTYTTLGVFILIT